MRGYEAAAEALLAVPPGAWVGPIETPDGWLVAQRQPYYRFPVSHVLVGHINGPGRFRHATRTEPEAMARAGEALAKLRADPGSWDRIVREYSDDPDSRERGGRLGDVSNVEPPTRRLPPEIEEATRLLKPGEISEVVPSRMGVEILRREP
jgi:parvulin-like peptidyl-prolyl isomerase